MAALVEGAAIGLQFTVLYEVIKDVVVMTSMFKPILDELNSKIESLKPLIDEIVMKNTMVDRDNRELHEIQKEMEDGIELIRKCSRVKAGPWNNRKKKKYTNKLVELDKSLARWLEILRQQARDLRMEVLMRQQIYEQRKARETLVTASNGTIDVVAETMVQTQSDIQTQPFSRQIQNYSMVYGSWAIMFILFLVGLVMATGSTGAKWFVFNIGINYLGINN
ncbi:hypothetical protein M0R45_001451 [Rubus argutus]|uniref:RPW8 domain-containing protein n=1 Tax=Rubus argutus TaxID=59490 RepID=A0AAW1VLR9_RUBAR